jgi:hypothetical protein
VINFQLRPAPQHDFATIIRFVQAMLNEMETLSSRELTDPAEAWLAFESCILQTLNGSEKEAPTFPCAAGRDMAHHLLKLTETIRQLILLHRTVTVLLTPS